MRAWGERRLRVSDTALAGVVGVWVALSDDVKAAARGVGQSRWDGACRAALRDARAVVRRNAARALLEVADVSLASLASELLMDADGEVARHGELALVAMVLRARSSAWSDAERGAWDKASFGPLWTGVAGPGFAPWGAKDQALLADGVAKGLNSLDVHRKRGVLLAALLLADRGFVCDQAGSGVCSAVAQREHPSHGPLMSLLRARAIPTGRLRALEWLPMPSAQRGAVARLSRADGAWDHELVLSAAHLGLRPARARALRSVKAAGHSQEDAGGGGGRFHGRYVLTPAGPLPTAGVVQALPAGARRMAPLWARSIHATSPQRHAALEGLLADPDPVVRAACVRHGVSSLRIDQVLDVDERVSRAAYLSWIADVEARQEWGSGSDDAGGRAEHSRLLALFSRLPHPRVRTLAALDRAFDSDPFSAALRAASVAGMAGAYRSFVANRAAFVDDLAARLGDVSQIGGGWSRAMHLAKRLGISGELEHRLREVAAREGEGADLARNVAQAVTVLGDVPTPTSRVALERALVHGDARVRANAVESLAKHARLARQGGAAHARSGDRAGIVEFKDDAHHRVRANAVRAALLADVAGAGAFRREDALVEAKCDVLGIGVESLAAMLSDDRTMHRLAGAWLAWKVLPAGGPLRLHARWPEVVARVAEVAQFDAEPKVRARAARCAQVVEASLAAASMHVGGMLSLEGGI